MNTAWKPIMCCEKLRYLWIRKWLKTTVHHPGVRVLVQEAEGPGASCNAQTSTLGPGGTSKYQGRVLLGWTPRNLLWASLTHKRDGCLVGSFGFKLLKMVSLQCIGQKPGVADERTGVWGLYLPVTCFVCGCLWTGLEHGPEICSFYQLHIHLLSN